MSELTTHIQGYGDRRAVRAVRASELQPGDVIIWPTTARVHSIALIPSKSGLFLILTTVTRDGIVYQRRKHRDCAIAFDRVGPVPILSGDLPEDHPRKARQLDIWEVCRNCQTPIPEYQRTSMTPTGFCCGLCALKWTTHDHLAAIETEAQGKGETP